MEITYQPNRNYIVGKRVNGGSWLSLGSFKTRQEAEACAQNNRAFHAERCPSDTVEYSISD